jgi:hypothetical protein
MPNITTCPECGALYEAGSEEQANEPGRLCRRCFAGLVWPSGRRRCPGCGLAALDGHITWRSARMRRGRPAVRPGRCPAGRDCSGEALICADALEASGRRCPVNSSRSALRSTSGVAARSIASVCAVCALCGERDCARCGRRLLHRERDICNGCRASEER